MTKIILCCSAGMSTSLFVQKALVHAEEIGEKVVIKAIPVADLDANLANDDWDIVVLAPQIRFQKELVEKKTDKPLFIIDMRDYGSMNVQKVLPEIINLVKH